MRVEVKVFLCANDMILYLENPKESVKKKTSRTNKFSKAFRYKINIQNQLCFCAPTMNNPKVKLRKIAFTTDQKK